jgi:hypothetical protein
VGGTGSGEGLLGLLERALESAVPVDDVVLDDVASVRSLRGASATEWGLNR